MRILITGGTGFIGRHTVKTALARGHQVAALHRPASPDKQQILRKLRTWGAELHVGELGDAESLRAAMRDIDTVCHFASAFRESDKPDDYFIRVNVDGTRNVMEAAAEQGVRRFVFCSTAGMYGSQVPGVIDETAPVKPANVYERSKVEAEKTVRAEAGAPGVGMEYAIFRPAVVYGPHDERLLKMFKSASKGHFPLFGNGSGQPAHGVRQGRGRRRAAGLPAAAGSRAGDDHRRSSCAAPLRDILGVLAHTGRGRESSGPRFPLAPRCA